MERYEKYDAERDARGDKEVGERSEYKPPEFLGPTRVRLKKKAQSPKRFLETHQMNNYLEVERADSIY